jgi:hypothetical protein
MPDPHLALPAAALIESVRGVLGLIALPERRREVALAADALERAMKEKRR